MTLSNDTKAALAHEALDAFWQVIARHFPQARTGDMCWDCVMTLQTAAEEAIKQFVENNVPGYEPSWASDS